MTKIILDNHSEESEDKMQELKKEISIKPNLFQGRTEAELQNAKFPEWDITPPNQFINPRIKAQ
ncbi:MULTISPECIES: hypothetical protein [Flavobacterium]|uniref:hypothetical protein n=1 Tax=Flavobacterium TaxID=237 RepID=UPI002114A8FD|nr:MULTISPECIES: hypothetical protein [Flavobacterium]UUF16562.1 hypothetical protein NLJ00_10670 [Flavobacterium panici]